MLIGIPILIVQWTVDCLAYHVLSQAPGDGLHKVILLPHASSKRLLEGMQRIVEQVVDGSVQGAPLCLHGLDAPLPWEAHVQETLQLLGNPIFIAHFEHGVLASVPMSEVDLRPSGTGWLPRDSAVTMFDVAPLSMGLSRSSGCLGRRHTRILQVSASCRYPLMQAEHPSHLWVPMRGHGWPSQDAWVAGSATEGSDASPASWPTALAINLRSPRAPSWYSLSARL